MQLVAEGRNYATTTWGDRQVGLRDAAIGALRDAGIEPAEIVDLDAAQVKMEPNSGRFIVERQINQRMILVSLTPAQGAVLLEYMEAERLWGRSGLPLFTNPIGKRLSTRRVRRIVERLG